MSEWQPIETAPITLENALIYDGRSIVIGAQTLGGRWGIMDWNIGRPIFLLKPTHWMPLPEPPKGN